MNFASRVNCRKCNKSNQPGSSVPVQQTKPIRDGDWICTKDNCNEHNFGIRDICRRCNGPRKEQKTIKPKQEDDFEDDSSEEITCVVCMTDSRTHAITKCGHLCYCGVCGFSINKCPVCRENYNPDTDLIKIYNI